MLLDIVKHIVKFVKNLFSSTKLGIFLLLVIVIVAIAGTLVEQGKPIQYYYDLYGSATAGWIIRLSIDKIFGSLWMIIPTSLLIVNLIYATLSRLPVMIKSVALPKQFHHNSKINDKFLIKDKDVAIENSSTILKSYHYKIYTLEDGSLFAHKGVVSRFGAVVVHLSILIVLFGALLGAIYGYKNYIAIDSGDTELVPEINASIKRSEEHTSELQSHSFISYAVFCLKKKNRQHSKKKKEEEKKQTSTMYATLQLDSSTTIQAQL